MEKFTLIYQSSLHPSCDCHPELVSGSEVYSNPHATSLPSLRPGKFLKQVQDDSWGRGCVKAFSLIELLIALIIISLVTAAFIPVLTKKIKHKEVVMASKSVSTDCSKLDDENRCLMCDSTVCSLCITQMSIPEGYYVEPNISCDYKKCVDKFFGCKTCNKDFCVECLEGYGYTNEDKSCVKCSSNCLNCSSATACTKCQAGYTLQKGGCKKITDAPCLVIGNICVAKFNAGDSGGLGIPDGLVNWKAPTSSASASGLHNLAICWRGRNTPRCDAANGGYSGCNRTVCTWSAANKICEHHGWRLPHKNEMTSFALYSISKGSNGLQLCEHEAGVGSADCHGSMWCTGSITAQCIPHVLWSADKAENDGHYYAYNLVIREWRFDKYGESGAYSARCVRDL